MARFVTCLFGIADGSAITSLCPFVKESVEDSGGLRGVSHAQNCSRAWPCRPYIPREHARPEGQEGRTWRIEAWLNTLSIRIHNTCWRFRPSGTLMQRVYRPARYLTGFAPALHLAGGVQEISGQQIAVAPAQLALCASLQCGRDLGAHAGRELLLQARLRIAVKVGLSSTRQQEFCTVNHGQSPLVSVRYRLGGKTARRPSLRAPARPVGLPPYFARCGHTRRPAARCPGRFLRPEDNPRNSRAGRRRLSSSTARPERPASG